MTPSKMQGSGCCGAGMREDQLQLTSLPDLIEAKIYNPQWNICGVKTPLLKLAKLFVRSLCYKCKIPL